MHEKTHHQAPEQDRLGTAAPATGVLRTAESTAQTYRRLADLDHRNTEEAFRRAPPGIRAIADVQAYKLLRDESQQWNAKYDMALSSGRHRLYSEALEANSPSLWSEVEAFSKAHFRLSAKELRTWQEKGEPVDRLLAAKQRRHAEISEPSGDRSRHNVDGQASPLALIQQYLSSRKDLTPNIHARVLAQAFARVAQASDHAGKLVAVGSKQRTEHVASRLPEQLVGRRREPDSPTR